MLNKKRVIGAMAMATVLLMSACGGGSGDNDFNSLNDNDKKIEEAVKAHKFPFTTPEETKLTIAKSSDASVKDFNTNDFTLYLEKKTGIDITIEEMTADAIKTALAADSEDLPDIGMHGLADAQFIQYGCGDKGTGALIPWDFYFENYGYYYKEALAGTQITKIDNFLIAPDGHRYTVPYICEQMGNVFSGKAWINKVWLEKLGLRIPTKENPYTTDELKDVLTKFKNGDPNGNGKRDEIPLTGSSDGYKANPWMFLMNSFIYCDKGDYMWVDDNGKLGYIYQTEEFKDGMKYISGLVASGLMQKESVVQKNADLKAISAADVNLIGVLIGGSPDNVFSAKLDRMHDYVPLPQPVGPKGVKLPYMQMMTPTYMGWMTRNCKYPLAAYTLLDLMMSEEATTLARYGVEGRDWKRATTQEEKDKALFKNIGLEGDIITILNYGELTNGHWQAQNPQWRSSKIADGMVWDGNPNNGEKVKADAITAYYLEKDEREAAQKHIVRKLKFETLDDQQNYSTLSSSIKSYVNQQIAKYVVGELNIEKDWNNFQAKLKELKIDECRELAQKGFDYMER